MTQPDLPPLIQLLPDWPYPFKRQRRDTGGPYAYVCTVPWSPFAPYSRTDPLFTLLVALVKLGLGPSDDFTLDAAFEPGWVVVTIAARSMARANRLPPSYGLFTDTRGSITNDPGVSPGEQWLTLETPSTNDQPPSSEPVEPVAHLLATALLAPLQVGHLLTLLDHALCGTCRHPLLAARIRHRQPLHTSSTDEAPDLECTWSCGHQVLPNELRCYGCRPPGEPPGFDADPAFDCTRDG